MIRLSKLYLFTLFLLCNAVVLLGQSSNPADQVIPPSPTASALGKYGEVPVGLYTGTPNVSVPLHTLTGKHLNVPISLSYHASGIKVDQIASQVGLGWSLNAGGVISRSVRGKPDDGSDGFLSMNDGTVNLPNDLSNVTPNDNGHGVDDFLENVADGAYDMQPDLFTFNVGGYSGKFTLDMDGNVHVIPYQDVIIDFETNGVITSWTIRTPDGLVYKLGEVNNARETTLSVSTQPVSSQFQGFTSSWYLTSITHPTGEKVIFNYIKDANHPIQYATGKSMSKYRAVSSGMTSTHACATPPGGGANGNEVTSSLIIETAHLQSIVTDHFTAEFEIYRVDGNGTHTREDLHNGVRLDKINIKNGTVPIKSFEFLYDYFGADNTCNSSQNNSDFGLCKRLKLLSVNVLGANGTPMYHTPFTFDYLDKNVHLDYKLPPRLSYSQDHWGYYNGAANNTFIPTVSSIAEYANGADRSTDTEHVKAGSLYKIHYPTGGYTEFEFEAHSTTDNMSGPLIESHLVERTDYSGVFIDDNDFNSINQSHSITFTLNFGQTITVNHIIKNDVLSPAEGEINIINSNGQIVQSMTGTGSTPVMLTAGTYTLETKADRRGDKASATISFSENVNFGFGGTVSTTVGGLRLSKMTVHDGNNNASVKRYEYLQDGETIEGGKLISLPKYSYNIIEDRLVSMVQQHNNLFVASGNMSEDEIMAMINSFMNSTNAGAFDQCGLPCSFQVLSSSSQAPLGMSHGSHIVYPKVTVYEGENGENGKVEHRFSYASNTGGTSYPFRPPTNFEWKRGHLLSSTVFKNDNGAFKKVSITEHTYDFREDKSLNNHKVTGLAVGFNRRAICPESILLSERYKYASFDVIAPWYYQTRTTYTVFDGNGQNPIVTITDYIFDEDGTDGHQTQPILTKTTNSDGVEYTTQIKYSSDYAFTGAPPTNDKADAIHWMQQNHTIVPIEQITTLKKPSWSQPKVTGGSISTFKVKSYTDASGNWEFLTPHETHVLETETPIANFTMSSINGLNNFTTPSGYELKGTVNETDAIGNLLEYSRTADIPTTIIWNNKGDLPIAKVVNASHNEVFYTSFEESIAAISIASKTGQYAQQIFGGQYPIPNSASFPSGDYILSYWKQVNGEFVFIKTTISHTTGNNIAINGTGLIDEVRLYPADAIMSTISHDENTRQVTHMTNENGQIARFEYDDFQRLEHIYDFEDNLISKYEYKYQNPQSAGNNLYNHIQTWTFLKEGVTPQNLYLNPLNDEDFTKQYQFTDGLGRPMQSIAVGQATDGGDIVSHIEYDNFGRADKAFLPFVTSSNNNGAFVTNAGFQQETYNLLKYSTTHSFAQSSFEASPLNRVVEQGAVGNEWQLGTGHTIQSHWRGNIANEVYDFENNQFYAANEIAVTTVTDENGVKSWSFSDKLGRTILTKREAGSMTVGSAEVPAYSMTYYLYDDFGRIRKVMPPEAVLILENNSWNENDNALSELIYTYTYDKRGRITEKKIPGAAVQYLMYDELDRVVLTQDGNLRSSNQWLFTEYDVLSRPVATGIYTNTVDLTRTALQTDINAEGLYESRNNSFNGYSTNGAFPTSGFDVHTVTYYDDYDFDGDGTDDVTPDPAHLNGATYAHLHGKLTGTRVKVLDHPSTNTWLKTVTFFDDRGRVIQIHAENHMGGADVTSNQYDFAGRLLKTVRDHSTSTNQLYIASDFSYDHASRLLFTRYGVGNTHTEAVDAQVVLSKLEYDQIGQMVEKKLHSTNDGDSYLQNVDFEYNIRGWLSSINNVNDMAAQGGTQLSEIKTGWYNPHSNPHTYYYGETLLMPGQDGAMELTYNGTVRTYCSWRRVLPDGSDKPMMQLVKHTNGSWYVWDKNFATRMSKPSNFVAVGQKIRLERVGDEFRVYVGGQLKHTIVEAGSSQEEMIPVGILSNGAHTDHAFYRYLPVEAADVFAMRLDYTVSNTNTAAEAQYNGNISQVVWKTMGDTKHSAYGFQYDELNRLKQAKYAQYEVTGQTQQVGQPSNLVYSGIDNYTVSNITYDLNGNIETLNRRGWNGSTYAEIDQMSYTYENNSNILKAVADAANTSKGFKEITNTSIDYLYDSNGNLTRDNNKGIDIFYNYMNLPTKVSFDGGEEIRWMYDAAGVKLSKTTETASGNLFEKHYLGGIEYVGSATEYVVEALYNSEGRLLPQYDGNGSLVDYQYEYTVKDHLGNARVSFADIDKDGEVVQSEILQTNHYYPFGMTHEPNTISGSVENTYQYNSKELNTDFGLDWLDYGARWYDASIGRFSVIDRFAEKYYDLGSYHYVANNPIRYIDVNGDSLWVDGMLNVALDDVKSTLPSSYQSKVREVSGKVYFDITEEEMKASGDLGVETLFELVNSPKYNYMWRVAEEASYKDRYTGEIMTDVLNGGATGTWKKADRWEKYAVVREVKTVKRGKERIKKVKGTSMRPDRRMPVDDKFDIERTFSPQKYAQNTIQPRPSVVLHEFLEMIYETRDGLPYTTNPRQYVGPSLPMGAHNKSIDTMKKRLEQSDVRRGEANGSAPIIEPVYKEAGQN